jgi:hypothetical protein
MGGPDCPRTLPGRGASGVVISHTSSASFTARETKASVSE